MVRKRLYLRWSLLLLWVVGGSGMVWAESSTLSASGTIYSAETGETMPFTQVYFVTVNSRGDTVPTTIGTTSNIDGVFSISNSAGHSILAFQMVGYKTYYLSLRTSRKGLRIKLEPDVYMLSDVVIRPPKRKERYKRKGNPAVELVEKVIANRDSLMVKSQDFYTADSYSRMSFALDNFYPDFSKPFWKSFAFAEKYIDTTDVYPSVTVSIREYLSKEYFQKKPLRERIMVDKKRIFGLEDVIHSNQIQDEISEVFQEPNIYVDNMELLHNRFVSPISSTLAVLYYKYYILDTIDVDGYNCIDLAFVPVNSESYSFTGHLYIVNDSTYKIKRYKMNVPPDINLNFVTDYVVEYNYHQLENGLWAPDRTTTYAKFGILKKKRTLLARQTKLYLDWDFQTPLDPEVVNANPYTLYQSDSAAQRLASEMWDTLRPEPLSKYESSVCDLVQEFTSNPTFASLALTANALVTEYVPTQPAVHMDRSKFDFGPIYSTVSWNMLEGVRLRVGGASTPKLHDQFFFRGYVAFGTTDLKPKYSLSLLYSFNKKKKYTFEPYRHFIQLTGQYDVEEPGQATDVIPRDNLFMSIPMSKPVMKNYQYVFHAKLDYMKEWENGIGLKANFDFTNNAAAGAMTYNRITGFPVEGSDLTTQNIRDYNTYTTTLEFIYSPGKPAYMRKTGQQSPFATDKSEPIISLSHRFGFLDDRYSGGNGFLINRSELTFDKRFWLSSFGHIDLRLQGGIIWNKVPFTELYSPRSSTSIFLALNAFNQMQPMEFLMDKYVALYCTYYLKGWILNRIPGINKLKLRGVVSFSGIYGGLSDKNNPFVAGSEGLYTFPESANYDPNTQEYISGQVCSPIGKLPYMECSVGIENIFKLIRIDYIRRITYNEYLLPDGIHTRKVGAWGRNGVKVTVRFSL